MLASYWGYVGAGYGIAATVLGGYTVWLLRRLRAARRLAEGEGEA